MSFLQVMQMQMPCPYGQKRNSRAGIVYARLNLGQISSQLNVQVYVRLVIVFIQNPSIPFEIQLIKSQQSRQIFWHYVFEIWTPYTQNTYLINRHKLLLFFIGTTIDLKLSLLRTLIKCNVN